MPMAIASPQAPTAPPAYPAATYTPAPATMPPAYVEPRPATTGQVAFRDEFGFRYDAQGNRIDRHGQHHQPADQDAVRQQPPDLKRARLRGPFF